MATKTVVCPDCGAAAAAGRYACSECGALLASVALARPWSTADADDADRPGHGGNGSDQVLAAAAVEEPAWPDPVETAPRPSPASNRGPVAAAAPAMPAPHDHDPTSMAFDEDAPIASSALTEQAATPDVLHDLPDRDELDPLEPDDERSLEPPASSRTVEPALGGGAEDPPDGDPEALTAPAAFADVPTWPPAGDRGAVARPEPRTPAGAYLPPTAVLPPLDFGPAVGGAGVAAGVATADAGPSWAGRTSDALGNALDGVRLTVDGSRQAVVLGAGLAAIGLLLPWINGPLNEGALAGYLDRWGLAGGGMWLVLLGLAGLAFLAGSASRTTRWPIGLLALTLGAFVIGLVWPYLGGGISRSVGVWVVLAGAIVLAVGGALDRRERHAAPASGVPSVDLRGR